MRKDPIDMTIAELVELRETVEAYIQRAVGEARRGGSTWAGIADSLGVSPQEAHRRWRWLELGNRTAPPKDDDLPA